MVEHFFCSNPLPPLCWVGIMNWDRTGAIMARTAWRRLDDWTPDKNNNYTFFRRLCIFYMCAVWPYLHCVCVCARVQICIFISLRYYFIETFPNNILSLPYTLVKLEKLESAYLTAFKVHLFFFLKYLLKIPCILYAICRFKIRDSEPKLTTGHLLV